jgi:hypothetical protein
LSERGSLYILAEGDFDGDGHREAFVSLHPNDMIAYNANEDYCIYLFLYGGGYTILNKAEVSIDYFEHYVLDSYAHLFSLKEYLLAHNESTDVYTVVDSRAVKLASTGPSFSRIDNSNQFYISTGFIYSDYRPMGGATHKRYWLFWDGGLLREYGGLRVSEDQLRRFAYGRTVLDALKDEGHIINEIYYRGNGVINVNYSRIENDGTVLWEHKNLLYRNGEVTDIPVDWGYNSNFDNSEEKYGYGHYNASYHSATSSHWGQSAMDVVYPSAFP